MAKFFDRSKPAQSSEVSVAGLSKSFQARFFKLAESFYDVGSGLGGRMLKFLRLERFSLWLSRRFSKSPMMMGIESFVAVSLTVYFFFLMFPMAEAPRHSDGNEMNAYLFTYLSHHPYAPHKDLYSEIVTWRARVAGSMIAGAVYDTGLNAWARITDRPVSSPRQIVFGTYRFDIPVVLFSLYHTIWLFLLFVILILNRKDALWIMLGVFSGLMYNMIMPSGTWFYPWDLPAMFFFTWACLVFDKHSFLPLLTIVWLGSLFKETILCCSLLILLGERWPLKKRIIGFAVTLIACILSRKLLMSIYHVKTMIYAFNYSADIHQWVVSAWGCFVGNVNILFKANLNHVLFVNAGTFLIMMLIPWQNRREVVFKALIIIFIIGLFLFGNFPEFRIWYEILPLGWMIISEAVSNRYQIIQEYKFQINKPQFTPDRMNRVMKGSYWLIIGGLFAVLLGTWILNKWH